jgi:hypothetical protein
MASYAWRIRSHPRPVSGSINSTPIFSRGRPGNAVSRSTYVPSRRPEMDTTRAGIFDNTYPILDIGQSGAHSRQPADYPPAGVSEPATGFG